MVNTTLVHDLVFKDALRTFRNETKFANTIKPRYDDSYSNYGAKAGSPIRLMTPVEYTVREGNNMDVKDSEEKSVTIDRSILRGIDIKFSSSEMEQDVDSFNATKVAPAMATLAAYVDNFCLDLAFKEVYQAVTLPTTSVDRVDILNAGVKLDNGTAGRSARDRCMLLNPQGMSEVTNDSSGLFNNATSISQQYDDGIIKVDAMGFKFGMTQNIPSLTTGTFTTSSTPLTNGVGIEGATTLVTDGWQNSTAVLSLGDIFTIASVNQVNALNKKDVGVLQQFVVTAAGSSDGSGDLTIAMEPPLISTGPYQNITALPADGAAIVPLGTEATLYPQNLAYHMDFGAIGFIDLPKPSSGNGNVMRKVEDGVSMRMWIGDDIITNTEYIRFDVLFGYKTVIPRHAARVYGL